MKLGNIFTFLLSNNFLFGINFYLGKTNYKQVKVSFYKKLEEINYF